MPIHIRSDAEGQRSRYLPDEFGARQEPIDPSPYPTGPGVNPMRIVMGQARRVERTVPVEG